MANPHQPPLTLTEEKLCQPCEQPVEDKIIPCPLQCRSPKCKAYKNRPPLINTSKTPIVWILGGPGCGKQTQCDKIVAKYGFVHLSSGDLLRNEVKSGTERARYLNDLMEKGELVPNDIVLDLLKEAMLEKVDHAKGFLIDGYPRERRQGMDFERIIAPASAVIYFHASEKTLLERLAGRATQSGRSDDNPETCKNRLKVFFENNDGVLAQHAEKVHRINADRPPDEIFVDVEKVIDHLIQIKWPLDP